LRLVRKVARQPPSRRRQQWIISPSPQNQVYIRNGLKRSVKDLCRSKQKQQQKSASLPCPLKQFHLFAAVLRIRIRILESGFRIRWVSTYVFGLLDPDALVRGLDPDPSMNESGSFYQQSKIFLKKIFIGFFCYFSLKVKKKSQNSRNSCFSYYFCLMIEGSIAKSGFRICTSK
jgi:hypothetical protein